MENREGGDLRWENGSLANGKGSVAEVGLCQNQGKGISTWKAEEEKRTERVRKEKQGGRRDKTRRWESRKGEMNDNRGNKESEAGERNEDKGA